MFWSTFWIRFGRRSGSKHYSNNSHQQNRGGCDTQLLAQSWTWRVKPAVEHRRPIQREEQIRGEVELNGEDLQQTAMFVLGEDSHNNLCYCCIIRPVQPDSVSSFCWSSWLVHTKIQRCKTWNEILLNDRHFSWIPSKNLNMTNGSNSQFSACLKNYLIFDFFAKSYAV